MSSKPEHRKEPPHTDLREWARAVPARGATKAVLLGLVMHANQKHECWPSIKTLAHTCGLSERGVIKGLKALENDAWIIVTRRNRGKTGRQSNLYHINLSKDAGRYVNQVHLPSEPDALGYVNHVHPEVPVEVTEKNNPPIVPPPGGRSKRYKREPIWKTATRKALEKANDITD